jgi:hypothetical protein
MKWLLSLSAVVALSSTLALAQTPISRAINKWQQQPRKDRRDFVERVKAGRRNARANGKRLGRPSRGVDAATVAKLRGQGAGWHAISIQRGVGLATLHRAAGGRSKTREKVLGTPRIVNSWSCVQPVTISYMG